MPKPPIAPHDAVATYICTTDATRVRKYPFREGSEIPREVVFEGFTFALRAVMYEASGFDVTRAA